MSILEEAEDLVRIQKTLEAAAKAYQEAPSRGTFNHLRDVYLAYTNKDWAVTRLFSLLKTLPTQLIYPAGPYVDETVNHLDFTFTNLNAGDGDSTSHVNGSEAWPTDTTLLVTGVQYYFAAATAFNAVPTQAFYCQIRIGYTAGSQAIPYRHHEQGPGVFDGGLLYELHQTYPVRWQVIPATTIWVNLSNFSGQKIITGRVRLLCQVLDD